MIVLHQVKIPCGSVSSPEEREKLLRRKVCQNLHWSAGEPFRIRILRHSVDARKKPDLFDVYSIGVTSDRSPAAEKKQAARLRNRNIVAETEIQYRIPAGRTAAPGAATCVPGRTDQNSNAASADAVWSTQGGAGENSSRPVVVGFGPAGIFCSLLLARAGLRPIVLERGRDMEERCQAVEEFWQNGQLDPFANCQFGEGGAGTFSDGKLNTNVKDKAGRTAFIMQTFIAAGAPEDIAYEAHPHIGTDRLRQVIVHLRQEILSLGGEVRFRHQMERLLLDGDRVRGVQVSGPDGSYSLPADTVVLALGHSARDTIRALRDQQVPMTAKSFAVGLRVSHPQRIINERTYGISNPDTLQRLHLPAANYKLTARAGDGHGVYSFCMCPGGYVVNASSSSGFLAVNGMSDYARDSARANSAVVVTVGPEDYGTDDVLDGVRFQEELEQRAYALAGGKVPAEWYRDFETGFLHPESSTGRTDSAGPADSKTLCIKGQCQFSPVHTLLPANLTRDFIEGMQSFEHDIPGFAGEEALVCGVESRTSSPVRIPRDAQFQTAFRGLYPCGEGAGYAGGITSAAIDGMKTAEAILARCHTD